ncbi:hypothetical protein [Paracoccus sp. PAMC 22219]|uniref:hypothetical protein n=1 Tax=Paracoccus sp. PAMC 22219 TaxID=1569209 RepID=UPI0018CD5EEE|nr:hypothetical protein [Paracoccus sp. PAMC 22219]
MIDGTRRMLFCGVTGALLTKPRLLLSQQDQGCSIISAMIIRAEQEATNATAWALTAALTAIPQMEQRISSFEAALSAAMANETAERRRQVVAYANAVGSIGFFAAGLAVSGSAVVLLFAGSIVFTGTIMLADTLTAPADGSAFEIVTGVGLDRTSGVLSSMGEDAYALSRRSAQVSSVASKVLSSVGVILAIKNFSNANDRYREIVRMRVEIEDQLRLTREGLAEMRDTRTAEEMRRACMSVLRADLEAASSLSCRSQP